MSKLHPQQTKIMVE